MKLLKRLDSIKFSLDLQQVQKVIKLRITFYLLQSFFYKEDTFHFSFSIQILFLISLSIFIFNCSSRFRFSLSIFNSNFQFRFSILIINFNFEFHFVFRFRFLISIFNINSLPYDLSTVVSIYLAAMRPQGSIFSWKRCYPTLEPDRCSMPFVLLSVYVATCISAHNAVKENSYHHRV